MAVTTVRLKDLFTPEELKRAIELWQADDVAFHGKAREEIVKPAMGRIQILTGQENDADYLTYCLEYALSKGEA